MVVQGGRVVDQWGEVEEKIEVRSIRKSLLSAMFVIYGVEGQIGIDHRPLSLTAMEKQATIPDLIRARSAVYHDAAKGRARTTAAKTGTSTHSSPFSRS